MEERTGGTTNCKFFICLLPLIPGETGGFLNVSVDWLLYDELTSNKDAGDAGLVAALVLGILKLPIAVFGVLFMFDEAKDIFLYNGTSDAVK